jgi:hypothetical protein
VNENCERAIDLDSVNIILANADGDFACNKKCYEKYQQQRDHFLEHILPNDRRFARWLGVHKSQKESFHLLTDAKDITGTLGVS